MSDSSTLYYFIPSDVINLLLDYLPVYTYEQCRTVPMFANHDRVHCEYFADDVVADLIVKNDINYLELIMLTVSQHIGEPNHNHCTVPGSSVHYITDIFNYVCDAQWLTAIKYGRIRIMELFQNANTRYKISVVRAQRFDKGYVTMALKAAPNVETIHWILTWRDLAHTWAISHIIADMIKTDDIRVLEAIESFDLKRIQACDEPFKYRYPNYIAMALRGMPFIAVQHEDVHITIKKHPIVLEWLKQPRHNWSPEIYKVLNDL
jgi:hypothetical protein